MSEQQFFDVFDAHLETIRGTHNIWGAVK
jgi:hypothetical protein